MDKQGACKIQETKGTKKKRKEIATPLLILIILFGSIADLAIKFSAVIFGYQVIMTDQLAINLTYSIGFYQNDWKEVYRSSLSYDEGEFLLVFDTTGKKVDQSYLSDDQCDLFVDTYNTRLDRIKESQPIDENYCFDFNEEYKWFWMNGSVGGDPVFYNDDPEAFSKAPWILIQLLCIYVPEKDTIYTIRTLT